MYDFEAAWLDALEETLQDGHIVSPRGQRTKEVLHRTLVVSTRAPVLMTPDRKLNYRFMAAEAFWILSGDDRVETIAPYNKRIANFSDDGMRFFGAYGPKIKAQLPYVVAKLLQDQTSRQAGLTIWRESPPATKDVPCTVAIFFSLRDAQLHCHVFMRSSDLWLGVPYDVFNFSMLTHLVCGLLNESMTPVVEPGELYLTAASSHLYETNWDQAQVVLSACGLFEQPLTPEPLFLDPRNLMTRLEKLRDVGPNDPLRWWEQ